MIRPLFYLLALLLTAICASLAAGEQESVMAVVQPPGPISQPSPAIPTPISHPGVPPEVDKIGAPEVTGISGSLGETINEDANLALSSVSSSSKQKGASPNTSQPQLNGEARPAEEEEDEAAADHSLGSTGGIKTEKGRPQPQSLQTQEIADRPQDREGTKVDETPGQSLQGNGAQEKADSDTPHKSTDPVPQTEPQNERRESLSSSEGGDKAAVNNRGEEKQAVEDSHNSDTKTIAGIPGNSQNTNNEEQEQLTESAQSSNAANGTHGKDGAENSNTQPQQGSGIESPSDSPLNNTTTDNNTSANTDSNDANAGINEESTTTTTTLPPELTNNKKGDADSSSSISSSVWVRVPLLIVFTLACIVVC